MNVPQSQAAASSKASLSLLSDSVPCISVQLEDDEVAFDNLARGST